MPRKSSAVPARIHWITINERTSDKPLTPPLVELHLNHFLQVEEEISAKQSGRQESIQGVSIRG